MGNNNCFTMKQNDIINVASFNTCKDAFIQFIRNRLGIVIQHYQIKDLEKTVLNACEQFKCTPQEYLDKLIHCPNNSPLLEHLIAGVTIGETYFFRDKQQMELLETKLLNELITFKRKKGDLSLRIWSAGCASGEEIYTVAMILCELLPDILAWRIQLLGTDINTSALQLAIDGCYDEWSMRCIPDYFLKKYFSKKNDKFYLSTTIRNLVKFSYHNLNADNFPSILNNTNANDLIVCRNVLIYFDSEINARLMKKLNASLVEGGILLLGASDPINVSQTDLIINNYQEAIFLQRVFLPKTTHEKNKKSLVEKNISSKIQSIKTMPHAHADVTTKLLTKKKQLISTLLEEGRSQEVLDIIETLDFHQIDKAFLLDKQAKALANLGQLEKAVKFCQQSLALNSTKKEYHLTLALILLELNRLSEAETTLRKTLFLDHNFVMGHYQLGLLLLRKNQKNNGLKSLHNALAIVEKKPASESVEEIHGLNYERLAEILKNEINLYTPEKSANV